VSAHKRLFLIPALALIISVGVTTAGAAQGFRGRGAVRRVVVTSAYYDPFWFYDPWWGYGYQWGPYPYPYRYYNDPGAAVRLDVKPKEAEVYVDSYYAGIVDDFNGAFQRLRLPPGEHEITLYRDGYRTVTQKVYLTPDNTFKIKYAMEPLAAGEQPVPRPQPPNPPPVPQTGAPPPTAAQPPVYLPPGRGPGGRRAPQAPLPPPPNAPTAPGVADGYGTLTIRVQPADADVLIDGEVWQGPSDRDRLVVDVAEGRHTIEIRKPGYRTYVTEVQVRRGDMTPLNVSLRTQDEQ
jgi:hypothetical protein